MFGDSADGSRKWGYALVWMLSGSRGDSRIGSLLFIQEAGGTKQVHSWKNQFISIVLA